MNPETRNAIAAATPGRSGKHIWYEGPTVEQELAVIEWARTNAPDSQGSQFFIVLDDAAAGPLATYNTYAIFGSVSSGMDVVDAIAAMPNSGEPNNAALEPVAMEVVTVAP